MRSIFLAASGFFIATLSACVFPSPLSAAESTSQRPNILFILVDDQSPYDLKTYNPKSELQTPNLDRLAAQGMVVDSARHMGAWVGAVCTSSRHMIMSGRTLWHIPDRGGKTTNNPNAADPALVPPDLAEHTMAAVFNRAGYDTMRTCKKGNSYDAANAQFTVVKDSTKRGGTDPTGSHWHAQQVLEYLSDRDKTEDVDPFLIYFGFSHPHDTRDGKPELLQKYGAVNHTDPETLPPANDRQPKLPTGYLPAHPFHHGQPGLRDEEKVSGVWTNRDEQTIRNETGREFACSENIDVQIGRVLDKLESMGELDNTYVVYTSDHGMAIGRHGLQGKQNLYEHTWRVPMIVQGPGIAPGTRAEGNVYLLDILATLCDLAGVPAPPTNEGISFKPVLEGKSSTVRDTMYGCYCGGTKPGMRTVRKGDWKLIQYDVLDGTVREQQLFNLAQNPHEYLPQHHQDAVVALTGDRPGPDQTNLADHPDYQSQLKEMESLLLAEMRRLDDPHRLWNQPDDGLTAPASASNGRKAKGKNK
ncbi:sulfatase-like hydrolase/transferase [Rubripirellula lacrimiformis]|nr:sulfatase-like hydrolase/transferase [Rubripirellula lacrimiformis]